MSLELRRGVHKEALKNGGGREDSIGAAAATGAAETAILVVMVGGRGALREGGRGMVVT